MFQEMRLIFASMRDRMWSLCVVLLLMMLTLKQGQGQDEMTVEEIDVGTWQQAYNENQRLLLLLYSTEGCDLCPVALDSVSQILGQPEIPSGVQIAKSSSSELISKLQVTQLPKLIYLREKAPVLYDGTFDVEDLLQWIQLAAERCTQRLDEDSFEHLTQAATGATTGDWLVAFYKETCKDVLVAMETLGVRVRGQMNVAKVNIADSPALVDRFKVTKCPEVIFYKKGKMYRYELPVLDVPSLRSFVDGFYKNVKAENVPLQKSQFDFLTESIADFIKDEMKGDNKTTMIAVLSAIVIVFLIVVVCCCRSVIKGPVKYKKE